MTGAVLHVFGAVGALAVAWHAATLTVSTVAGLAAAL